MNAPDKLTRVIALTRELLPAPRTICVPGSYADIRVPLREIKHSNGEAVTVQDTSGPDTDPQALRGSAGSVGDRSQRS